MHVVMYVYSKPLFSIFRKILPMDTVRLEILVTFFLSNNHFVSLPDVSSADNDPDGNAGLYAPALGAAGCPLHIQLHVLMQVWGRGQPGYPFYHPQVAGQRQGHQLRRRSLL